MFNTMLSPVAAISAALVYDSVETTLAFGSFADACRVAIAALENAPVGDDSEPCTCRTLVARIGHQTMLSAA